MLFDEYYPEPRIHCTISMDRDNLSLFEAYDGRLDIPKSVYEIKVRDKTSGHGGSEMNHFCSVKVKRGKISIPVVVEAKNGKPAFCYYESGTKPDKKTMAALKYACRLMLHNLDIFIDIWKHDNQKVYQDEKLALLEKAIDEYDYNDDNMLTPEHKAIMSNFNEKAKVKK